MPKISQLPTLTNITTGSIIPVVESSLTQKLTVGKLFEFLSGALDETFTTEVELLRSASSITSSFNEFASASTLSIAEKLITSSFESLTASFNSFSSSVNTSTASLNSYTASNDSLNNTQNGRLNELQSTSASLNSYTSSNDNKWGTLGALTGSFAITGSNTFNGNQTINGSIILDNGAVIKDTSNYGISFGYQAGLTNQGTQSLALGNGAGYDNQSHGTIAVGTNAGAINQGLRAVALGSLAGTNNQGEYAIAIGNFAAPNNQASHSIVISAMGSGLENTTANSLKIEPIRNVTGSSGILQYDSVTKEVSYSDNLSNYGVITSSNTSSFATTGSNTFVGNQIVSGTLTIATNGGDEGGEILLGKAVTNTTLTGSGVVVDIFRDRVRIFEDSGSTRGAFLNIVSQSSGVSSQIVTSPNLFSIQTITSASYAALTPVSGTLYIIIG